MGNRKGVVGGGWFEGFCLLTEFRMVMVTLFIHGKIKYNQNHP